MTHTVAIRIDDITYRAIVAKARNVGKTPTTILRETLDCWLNIERPPTVDMVVPKTSKPKETRVTSHTVEELFNRGFSPSSIASITKLPHAEIYSRIGAIADNNLKSMGGAA